MADIGVVVGEISPLEMVVFVLRCDGMGWSFHRRSYGGVARGYARKQQRATHVLAPDIHPSRILQEVTMQAASAYVLRLRIAVMFGDPARL
jgi:hypothetical protein